MVKKWIRIAVVFVFAAFMVMTAAHTPRLETDAKVFPATEEPGIISPETDYLSMTEKELLVLAYDGDPTACYRLGVLYDYGVGETQQNFSSAFDWYRTADAYGQNQAACGIGYLYLNGCGVEQDLELARQYFIRAIDLGDPQGYVGLGRIGLEKGETDKQAKKEIFANMKQAKRQGVLDGKYYTGYLYEKGIGVKRRPKRALRLYRKVVESDSTATEDQYAIHASRTRLGVLYMEGIGTVKDPDAAREQFEEAAEDGYAMAEYYLGITYEMGYGVPVDYGEALRCFERAAQKNYAPALNEIGCMYFDGRGVDANYTQAVYYQKLAAALGYEKAQVNLGFLYENGYGVEENLSTALMYYEMAEKTGYPGASEAIARVKSHLSGTAEPETAQEE